MNKRKTLIIIDAYNFLFRAYYALPKLEFNGLPVGAVYGFINILLKYISVSPEYFVIASDTGRSTFREKIFSEYKANRPPIPGDLTPQFALLRELVSAFDFNFLEQDGYEADDIIATLVENFSNDDLKIIIISSDKDLMQLVTENVLLLDPLKDKFFAPKDVLERFGVLPNQIVDYLSLVGDVSDNVPGIPGIGPKTASKLLKEFSALENINPDSITKIKLRESLIKYKGQSLISKRLVTLEKNVKISSHLDDIIFKKYDEKKIVNFLEKYGFKNIIKKVIKPKVIPSVKKLDSVDLFTTGVLHSGYLAIYQHENKIYFATNDSIADFNCDNIPTEIIKMFKDRAILKIFHSDNYHFHDAESVEDLKSMAYVLNTIKTSLNALLEDLQVSDAPENIVQNFYKIYKELRNAMHLEKSLTIYYKTDALLAKVIAQMFKRGILIDREYLLDLSIEYKDGINSLQDEIFGITNEKFLLSSPKQLGEVLFEKMKLPAPKKSKTGHYSTNSEILEDLKQNGFEIADKILEWRKFTKLQNTYIDPLINRTENTSRISTTYNLTSTITGRFSSVNPNLQNIPRNNRIKKIFIAKDGYHFISADYSQVELRILAYLADIKELQDSLLRGDDLHAITAAKIFKTDNVIPELRNKAKAINFGIIYGITGFGLAKQLNIKREEANQYINQYFSIYPGIAEYMEKAKHHAKENGYVKTKFGRKCYIENIHSSNYILRGIAERSAINAPIQGTAADIIRKAMVKISFDNELRDHLILQIHDELVFEAPKEDVVQLSRKVKQIMENITDIPLSTDIRSGKTLGELVSV